MARRHRLQFAGGIYHVTFRGNGRRDIFRDSQDYERLTARLAESAESFGVRIYMYCWMSNHGHLLVETSLANLSEFMRSVLTGYTVYFNLRHKTCGHLMQGRFGSTVVKGDLYVLRLSRYIHLNPVRTLAFKHASEGDKASSLRDFRQSSYRAYIGLDKPPDWLCTMPILATFGTRTAQASYRKYVEAALGESDLAFAEEVSRAPLALGSDEFVNVIKSEYARLSGESKPGDECIRKVQILETPDDVLFEVCQSIGVSAAQLREKRRDAMPRAIAALALIRRCVLTRIAVGERFGISGQAVGAMVSSLKLNTMNDEKLSKTMEELCRTKC